MSDHHKFRVEKLHVYLNLIEPMLVRERIAVSDIALQEPAPPRYDAPPDSGDWQPLELRGPWGGKQQWAYFRSKATIPASWTSGAIEIRLKHQANYLESPSDGNFPAGPEGQVFVNGERVSAIDREHHRIRVPLQAGQTYDLRAVFFAGRAACRHNLLDWSLALIDLPTEKLYFDLRHALEVIAQLEESSQAREGLIAAVDAAVHALDVRELTGTVVPTPDLLRDRGHSRFYGSVAAAQAAFDEARKKVGVAPVAEVSALGHAHIDLAWLWPIKQTHHKVVRTFATQVRLLNQYPDWIFQQSSPQAYKWLENDAPELFEKVKAEIAKGRWDADGATWVEPDTNLPSGESLVRQLLYGRRYFREKLGIDSKVLWLPDVFGYSAALPQLLKLAGVTGFVTSKISWSQYNRFPYDTFRWRGLDGTEIPTHFITTPGTAWFYTYNGMMTVEDTRRNFAEYRQKYLPIQPLLTFGYGDGGGGPTEEMLETALRLSNDATIETIPRVRFEKVGELMDRVAALKDQLPWWDGELYLEYHRGTYTTQAWLKRANRKNEINLHNAEWLSSLAQPYGFKLDKAKLDSLWEDLLLCHFHDILPGSSVNELYNEVRPMQANIEAGAKQISQQAADLLSTQIDTSKASEPLVLFNTLSHDRRDPVRLPDGSWRDDVVVPAGGWTVIDASKSAPASSSLTWDSATRTLSNQYWRLRIDDQGAISELYDRKADRQVLQAGSVGNQWQLFEDRSMRFDAWDIDDYYREHPLPAPQFVGLELVEESPVRIALELNWQLEQVGDNPRSTIKQRLAIYANNPRIDFETDIDWHEHHHLLKVAFPVDIRASEATYQIQFGHLKRATHRNTSWEIARFEGCGHRFVDLSEHGYGVALLNDSKYGHDILDGVIRLTCLKSPLSPDEYADRERHIFTYSLLPHSGSFQEAGVIQAAAELNTPLIISSSDPHSGQLPSEWRLISIDNPAIVLDTLKPAEDGNGLIARFYESYGSHAKAKLDFAVQPSSISSVNLMEEPLEEAGFDAAQASLRLRPFQVLSLRLTF
mgnify:CR=1 FL=1|jgi:Alpha-mannosidase